MVYFDDKAEIINKYNCHQTTEEGWRLSKMQHMLQQILFQTVTTSPNCFAVSMVLVGLEHSNKSIAQHNSMS